MLTIPASKSFHNTFLDDGNLHSKFLIFTKRLSTYILLEKDVVHGLQILAVY